MRIGDLITVPTHPGGHITLERAANTMIARRRYYADDMRRDHQVQESDCVCALTSTRNCPEHQEGDEMKDYQALPHRWTLSFYQAKGGVREITVADGPCLTGNTTVEVVPASHLEGVVEALSRIEGVYTRTMPGPRDALRDQVLEIIAAYRSTAGGQ